MLKIISSTSDLENYEIVMIFSKHLNAVAEYIERLDGKLLRSVKKTDKEISQLKYYGENRELQSSLNCLREYVI